MLSTELERHAKFFGAVFFLVAVLATFLLTHCALHRPPPCDPNAVYPDPCAYGITETVTDAGRDAR